MPMSGVRSQLLPWHGALSTRSLAPAASTAGWFASMASAGSLEPLGKYGVGGLPTVTLASVDATVTLAPVDAPLASAGTARGRRQDRQRYKRREATDHRWSSPPGDLAGQSPLFFSARRRSPR